jgi:sulfide:quinone oxidoreductase
MRPTTSSQPFTTVIAGGGVAALEAALTLRFLAGERVRITLLTPTEDFSYRPLTIREPFSGPAARRYPLARLVDDLHLTHHRAELRSVDGATRTLTTDAGEQLPYDALLLATGARQHPRFRHALNLDDRLLDQQLHGLVQDVEAGILRRLGFVVPSEPNWPIPIYELALQTARRAYEMGFDSLVTVVTPEPAPLSIFGAAASTAVTKLLTESRIATILGSACTVTDDGHLLVHPADRVLPVDRIIALPELYGPVIPGIAAVDQRGFVRVDQHCAVDGCERIYAAGDITDFPIKHGGLAAQQAGVAAEAIAALAGVPIDPRPLHPTLSAVLIGGPRPLYLRARLSDGTPVDSEASEEPLWSASAKVVAPCLGPYLEALDEGLVSPPRGAVS